MQAKIYNQKGKEEGNLTLPDNVFGVKWNSNLVHEVVTSMRSNERQGNAHAKDRSEVRGGGRKPWRQKGTGRARHGSRRSPIWVGGGVTHGPRNERQYSKKINKKAKQRALNTILSRKAKDGEIIFLSDLMLSEPKTKVAQDVLNSLAKIKGYEKINYKSGKRALILSPTMNKEALRSFRNIKSVELEEIRNVNPVDSISYKYLVFVNPEESLTALNKKQYGT
jgi:large subunit ribosomal protein L4